ncbi:MAG TPA: adenylyl-sulfate kinase [Anaerohalosphaeraceae bacterium]|nr:adenylyl-sulfate kinase [Anaerohalosphaeraceae bacterium]
MHFQPEKPGFVLWLTGLSGSGKSTLADRLAQILTARGRKVERLDGDTLRNLFPNTGFDRKSRDEHIRRVGFMAGRLEHHGVIVIASFISPYRDSRQFVRKICKNFIEVYVKASLEECKRRDVKGLYQKAQSGQIQKFTGLDDPYEEPENPEIIVDTEHETVDVCIDKIMTYIKPYL